MGDRKNASPEFVALQELQEEAGATCRSLEFLGRFHPSHGYANHCAHYFLALDAMPTLRTNPDTFEQIAEVKAFSIDEIDEMLRDGSIDSGDSAFALLLALRRLALEK